MPQTAQQAVNKMRRQLGEVDSNNSRWDDEFDLLYYLNQGRSQFAEDSLSVKGEYKRTTTIGKTTGNETARYTLDPTLWDIDNILWDGVGVDPMHFGEYDEQVSPHTEETPGRPRLWRRIGDAIDLHPPPDKAALLQVYGSIATTDLVLTETETQLNDRQLQAAIDYGCAVAMFDDDRDGTIYLEKYKTAVKKFKKKVHNKGPRQVHQTHNTWPH